MPARTRLLLPTHICAKFLRPKFRLELFQKARRKRLRKSRRQRLSKLPRKLRPSTSKGQMNESLWELPLNGSAPGRRRRFRHEIRESFSRAHHGFPGQSLPEEERSHKALIAVVVICLIIVGAIASVPYLRAHRQQIGAAIISIGRSVAGQAAPNTSGQPEQTSPQVPQQAASPVSPQGTRQPTQRATRQRRQAPAPTSAGPLSKPSPSGVVPGSTPVRVTKPSEIPAPSGSGVTGAVAPSASQTPASQLPSSTPAAKSGASNTSGTGQNPFAAPRAGSTSSSLPAGAASSTDNGHAEFKQAQRYLNGSGTVAADPAEAAEWFWRSLEKGNTPAAIPLADLYLEGKGVSRSCLQARILLTAASHKGNAEAIQKLSQLPENCGQ